jgi:hypothetical protein
VALVHGAFADSSGWIGVIQLLRAAGVRSVAVSNPCAASPRTPPTSRAPSPRSPGPVLAVGHSYGGAVISNAAVNADTLVLHAGDGFLIPPQTQHNARDLGPDTGRMLSTYIVEIGQPLSTLTG